MNITAKVSESLCDLNILAQTDTDRIAASNMSLKARILVLTQETYNTSGSDPKKISGVSAKMTASTAKLRSEILTFSNDAMQLGISDILPRIQPIQH